MQLGFLPRKGTTVPREVSEPWSLAALPSHSGPLDKEHRSPVTFTLPKPQGIQLLDQKGSTPHQLQLLGSKVFGVVRVDLAGYLGCESPPGWVTSPQTLFPPKSAQATGSYLLRFGVGVVQDHGHVALPPQVTEDTVVLHASR